MGVVVYVVHIRNSERTSDPRRPTSYVFLRKCIQKDETRIDHQFGQAVFNRSCLDQLSRTLKIW